MLHGCGLLTKGPVPVSTWATGCLSDSSLLFPSIQLISSLPNFCPAIDTKQFLYSLMVFATYRGKSHIISLRLRTLGWCPYIHTETTCAHSVWSSWVPGTPVYSVLWIFFLYLTCCAQSSSLSSLETVSSTSSFPLGCLLETHWQFL